jgi:hypothetical protein
MKHTNRSEAYGAADELICDMETRDVGNDLLDRAKQVSQKIEERVRALCSDGDNGGSNG